MPASAIRSLIIFDMDGTLVDAPNLDHVAFNEAILEVTGIVITEEMWSGIMEVTSQAVVHHALGKKQAEDLSLMKDQIRDAYLTKLRAGHEKDSDSILSFLGAVDVLSSLKMSPTVGVAIATGCWRETAHFKLKAAGFDISDIPFASASDCYGRAEIISLAAQRAGVPLEHAVYVGDGVWDYRATQLLGIPFIGTGRKVELLRKSGVKHTLEEWKKDVLLDVIERASRR